MPLCAIFIEKWLKELNIYSKSYSNGGLNIRVGEKLHEPEINNLWFPFLKRLNYLNMKNKKRCTWPSENTLMIEYHDREWGVPAYDDKILFEFLLLDSFQAGLSWSTILKKRKNFKKAFSNFNYKTITKYDSKKKNQLMKDAGIIRNRLKIESSVTNAKLFVEIQKEFGSFSNYIWGFVGNKPKINKWKTIKQIPAFTKESDGLSKDLKDRGFKFVGSTIVYAFMQSAGLVNDHIVDCFRYKEINRI